MAIDSVPNFLDVLKQNQLLEPGQFNEILPEVRRFTEPRTLAQHMLKQNWLTPYQVNQIFQGQGSGLVLGQYRLLERLGEGGMGQVFKARHQAMGRIVALKVIRKDRLENDVAVKRFRREIHAVAQLSHPNVVLAFDADAVGGSHFYVMEYVDGSDLSRLMKQQGALPVWQACDFIRQSALGLQHAHERGLVHRDIKPANLLLARADGPLNGASGPALPGRPKRTGGQGAKPTVKILDLGLARLADQADAAAATAQLSHDGTVFGTPDFMAPEQAKNSHNVDWRADIYSLGCTFYYLMAGAVPFPGGTNIEKLVRHQMDQPKPIEQLRNDVPPAVRVILQKMMAKRPEDRIQSCGEIAQALAPYCEQNAAPSQRFAAAAAAPARSGGRSESVTVKLSSTFAALRGLFIDPQTHQFRRIGLVIAAAVVLGLFGMLSVILALVATVGVGPSQPPTSLTTGGTGKQTSRVPPPPPTTTPQTTAKTPPRVALESPIRYLPENANNVWVFRMPEIVRSRVFLQNDNIIKANLSGFYLMLQPMGVDMYTDVDRLTYIVQQAGQTVEVYVLAQGRFDAAKYQDAIDRARPRPQQRRIPNKTPPAFYHEWPAAPGETSPSFTALVNANTFLFASDQRMLLAALQRAGTPRANLMIDKDVQHQLENIDDKPAMHLMVGGTLSDRAGTTLLDAGLRIVTLGFRPGDDLQCEYTMVARDDAAVNSYRTSAVPFFRDFLARIDSSGTLSSGLAGLTPAVNDATDTLTLRTRHSAADVAKMFKK